MTTPLVEQPWQRTRQRVPRSDRAVLSNPSLQQAVQHVEHNHRQLQDAQLFILGRSLADLRSAARETVLQMARDYTGRVLNLPVASADNDRLILSGHQPTLFHPGVWIKNFAIGHLSRRSGGIGLNLVVDNDNLDSVGIHVPVGTRDRPARQQILFDDDRGPQPWEDARLLNPRLFDSFADRVAHAVRDWGIEPMLTEFWPAATAYRQQNDSLRDCLTTVRQATERLWGLENLELPLSWICTSEPYLWFAAGILADLPRFLEIHNTALHQFRRVNRIRSQTHPVPELAAQARWLESPFWVWRQGETQRKRLFVERRSSELSLSDGDQEIARMPLVTARAGDGHAAVTALADMQRRGVRLRTRALTTTLFSRLCLADLFVHGIGGAKYDEMTDQIISRFYGIRAPTFHTITATLHMDLAPAHDVTPQELSDCRSRLRDIQFNPDRYISAQHIPAAATLIEEKREMIRQQQACRQARISGESIEVATPGYQRLHRLREINRQLAELAQDQRAFWDQEQTNLHAQLQANEILLSREYPFCLYPRPKLQKLMQSLTEPDGVDH